MRIKTLKISGFGSYADTTVLNFDSLGKSGIYLITGDTGAGKTTIFDAISFALYGSPSGSDRDSNMLRSKYSAPETPTEVVLDFEYADQVYSVRRNPRYFRPSKRGDGLVEEAPNSTLILPDGKVINKNSEVTKRIEEIIGLNKNQFSQIAMIAQGDFRKLLQAGTTERKEILQKIFKTDKFADLQSRLSNEKSDLLRQTQEANRSIEQSFGEIQFAPESPLAPSAQKAIYNELLFEDTVELIENLIAEDEALKQKTDDLINETEKKLSAVEKRLEKAEEYKHIKSDLDEAKEKLSQTTKAYLNAENDLANAKKSESKIEELKAQHTTLNNQLEQYPQLNSHKSSLADAIKNSTTAQKELDNVNKALNELDEQLKSQNEELLQYEDIGENIAELELSKSDINSTASALQRLKSDLDEIATLNSDSAKAQQEYLRKRELSDKATKLYDERSKAYLDEQAGILAETLTENLPCPVCGSLTHPQPAQKSENAPTKDELNRLKANRDTTQSDTEQASEKSSNILNKIKFKTEAVRTTAKELGLEFDLEALEKNIDERLEKLTKDLALITEKIKEIASKTERKKLLKAQIPIAEELHRDKLKQKEQISIRLTEQNTTIKNLRENIDSLSSRLSFKSEAEATAEINRLKAEFTRLEANIKSAQSKRDELDKAVTADKERVNSLSNQIESIPKIDIEAETKSQNDLTDQKNSLNSISQIVFSRLSNNKKIVKKVKEQSNSVAGLNARLTMVTALSDTANAKLSQKEKITLETYVQMAYFDRVIAYANHRLLKMTGEQYELKRRKESDNLKSQSGLDIDVVDHYNATERSVSTLSGGEAFKASLALALGLSEAIQSSSGGIRLNSMFVDEGFGSLDEESLKQAIDVLLELSSNNQLVGIISHVSELKDRIDKKIVVTKHRSGGSTAKIITE